MPGHTRPSLLWLATCLAALRGRVTVAEIRLAVVRLTADGVPVNAQTLDFGSRRFTHRITIADLAAGHLDVDVLRD